MPAYAYTGLSSSGKTIKGVESADSVAALKAQLKRAGVYLTSVSETKASAPKTGGLNREVDFSAYFDRIKQADVGRVTQLLGTLLGAGITLPESLAALTDQVESARFKGVLSDISNRVNEGSALADAFAKYPEVFKPLYINMTRAGEASGSLETVLLRISEFMEQEEELRSKVASAMLYPIIMGCVSAAVVALLMLNVVPQVTEMFDGMNVELPWNTKLLILVSDIVGSYWFLLIGAGFGVGWLFRRWRASEAGRKSGDAMVLRMPIVGDLARKVAISRFARTLSTMLSSGVQLLHALDIVRSLLGNVILEEVVSTARDNIREGEGIAPALKRSGEFPSLVTHMIAVGERSGQLESMLLNVADAYDREVNIAIGRMTAALEPLMIVVMGSTVGFIIFSVMQPIMMLNELAGQQ